MEQVGFSVESVWSTCGMLNPSQFSVKRSSFKAVRSVLTSEGSLRMGALYPVSAKQGELGPRTIADAPTTPVASFEMNARLSFLRSPASDVGTV